MLVVLDSLFNTSSLAAIILVGMGFHLRIFIIVASLSLWLGGLTFYSAVVAPVANRTIGGDQQGHAASDELCPTGEN